MIHAPARAQEQAFLQRKRTSSCTSLTPYRIIG